MGQLLLSFLCNFCSFSATLGVCPNNQPFLLLLTEVGLVIIFLISSDRLNCQGRVGTIVITIESGWNSVQVIFTKKILSGNSHFSLFWCIYCTITPEISGLGENINNTARVSKLSLRFLWVWFKALFHFSSMVIKVCCVPCDFRNPVMCFDSFSYM